MKMKALLYELLLIALFLAFEVFGNTRSSNLNSKAAFDSLFVSNSFEAIRQVALDVNHEEIPLPSVICSGGQRSIPSCFANMDIDHNNLISTREMKIVIDNYYLGKEKISRDKLGSLIEFFFSQAR
jgi:hypothetical protein